MNATGLVLDGFAPLFQVFDMPTAGGFHRDVRAHGVDAEAPRVAPYGMRQVWLKDPDGYVLCLQWPAGQPAS